MREPNWKEAYEKAHDELSALHPEYHGDDLDRLACAEADDYIVGWADMMIDRAKSWGMETCHEDYVRLTRKGMKDAN